MRFASLFAAAVAALSAPTYAVTGRIAGADGGWDLGAVDPVAHRLYLARGDGVTVVDLAGGATLPTRTPLGRGHGVAVVAGSGRVVAASGATNTAVLFDGATGRVLATLPTGTDPDAVAYEPATHTVWVFNPKSQDATVIDPAAAKVVATVAVGGSPELAAPDGEGRLYVNIEDRNEVAVIDARARRVVARHGLAGCEGPTGIAYAAVERQLVSACANGVAKVTTPEGREVATVKIGAGPDGAAVDEARHVALVPAGKDGTLTVIRLGATPRVAAVVPTARSARTIVLDPSTGAAYLPAARYAPAAPGGGRPAMVSGSFAILVVRPSR